MFNPAPTTRSHGQHSLPYPHNFLDRLCGLNNVHNRLLNLTGFFSSVGTPPAGAVPIAIEVIPDDWGFEKSPDQGSRVLLRGNERGYLDRLTWFEASCRAVAAKVIYPKYDA